MEYITAAMNTAVLVPDMEDGTYTGTIPGFLGVFATATTERDCRKKLQNALEQWVVFRASQNLDLPTLPGVSFDLPKAELSASRLEQVLRIEREIEEIRLQIGGVAKPRTFGTVLRGFNEGYKNYFPLISAALGVVVIIAAYFAYKVNPIQTYKDNLTKEVATDYYRELGDKFMNYGEFDTAADAYRKALEIDKYDPKANTGLHTAQIFRPLTDEAYTSSVETDVQLTTLRKALGNKKEYDYLVSNYEGINRRQRRDCSGAKAKFDEAIKLNPNFVNGYNQLGYTNLILDSVDIKVATECFENAKAKDPDKSQVYAPTLRDLGYCYLVQGKYSEAIELLSEAYNRLMMASISIKLGDAYRLDGQKDRARYYHQLLADGIKNLSESEEQYYLDNATFVYLDGPDAKKRFVQMETREQYGVFALYALSFDNALLGGDLKTAKNQFDEAFKLDRDRLYARFMASQIRLIQCNSKLNGYDRKVADWFESRLMQLSAVDPTDDRVSKMCDQ